MTNPIPATPVSGNRLLGLLDEPLRGQLVQRMEMVPLKVRQMLYEMGKPIGHAYFPMAGVISMVAEVEGAPESVVEVATVGNEGMTGLPLFLGTQLTPGFAFAQVEGQALRMTAKDFAEATSTPGPFSQLMHRYTQALFVQISQSTACNRVHSLQERCARWLLLTHDRVPAHEFDLTYQFLGQMLGERRAAVHVVSTMMEKAGFIRYDRGHVTILDRAGLEAASCGCYAIVRREYDRMLGPPQPKP